MVQEFASSLPCMDSEAVRGLIARVAKPSDGLQPTEVSKSQVLAEVLKASLREKRQDIIQLADNRDPLLQSCSGDCTPILVSKRIQSQLPDKCIIRRFGKESMD